MTSTSSIADVSIAISSRTRLVPAPVLLRVLVPVLVLCCNDDDYCFYHATRTLLLLPHQSCQALQRATAPAARATRVAALAEASGAAQARALHPKGLGLRAAT